ncbi:hypothetical protein NEMBOFW57_002891 [Staphylotrichum longicolle]|uniref:Uncharacterized protein n=1 Tax=Staphylotrichum longicolle TaxID=669026 RepID=A0AAD4I2V1_9PEZI|nr:hypothetical protein NEMBOFW57_002891 [Staphylotrichum longicolle]
MKNLSLVALSGAALLQVATAACCRNNNCLKAIAAPDVAGISDCSSNLAVTITPSAVTVTDTATVVESATETALFTETTTEIASTETVRFTETTTITVSTETRTIGDIITVPYTTTVFATAVPVTTTSYVYQTFAKARRVAETPLPVHATACADWDMYVKACKCAGVEPTTVTAEPATSTVTVPADNAITTIVGTVSSTLTDTVHVTATTSVTATNIALVVKTVTVTETATESVASIVQATETPSVVVPLTCRPTGGGWRASDPATVDWMAATNSYTTVGWQPFPSVPRLGSLAAQISVWTVNNGFLEHRYNIASNSMVMVPYLEKTTSEANAATVMVKLKSKSAVDSGVAAGTMERIQACLLSPIMVSAF